MHAIKLLPSLNKMCFNFPGFSCCWKGYPADCGAAKSGRKQAIQQHLLGIQLDKIGAHDHLENHVTWCWSLAGCLDVTNISFVLLMALHDCD